MDIQQMMRQAQKLKDKIEQKQKEVAETQVEGSAGGGMVVVTANCNYEVLSVKIEPEVVNADDVEMLQDLFVAATNQALTRARETMQSEMQKLTGGIAGGLPPGLF